MNHDPLDDELAEHFEQLKQERLDAGDTEIEARRKARLRLGPVARIQDDVRDTSLAHRLEMAMRHFRFALRSYSRNGRTYILATAILALGIGLSVAMFSLVKAVVLNPLPFPDQDRVHLIWKTDTQVNQQLVGELAFPELEDLRANIPGLAAIALMPTTLYGHGIVLQVKSQEPVQYESSWVSAEFFQVLGVAPVLGRGFEVKDEYQGAEHVAILSDRVWREQFGADSNVIGRVVPMNGEGRTVIGVMPPEFDFPRGAHLWMPLKITDGRGNSWFQAIVRLRPGVSTDALSKATQRTFDLQITDFPKEYSRTQRAVVMPIAEYWTGASKSQLLVSMFASLLLLVSACISAGNLFLSRALYRRRDVATRISLGASPRHILLGFAIEGLLAAALATAAGSALATVAVRLLIGLAPADIPRIGAARLDIGALLFASAAALCASIACTVGPGLLLRRGNLERLLRDGGTRTAGSRTGQRLQNIFVCAQAALTVAILAVGLLLFTSYQGMIRTDTGFSSPDTLTLNTEIHGPDLNTEKRRRFYRDVLSRLRAAPQVVSAAGILLRPFEGPIGWDSEYMFEFEAGLKLDPNQLPKANFEAVTPDYFATAGTALLSGRDFTEHDNEDSARVMIISRSIAQKIPGDPIGRRIQLFGAWRKIIGVVANARYRRVVQSNDDVYVPYTQVNAPVRYLMVRGRVGTSELLSVTSRILREVDPAQAIAGQATLGELIARNTARDRFNVSLMILFAIGAVVLAAAGIHSVVRESVAVRAKEIAVRVALGATSSRLVAQTTRNALLFVFAGQLIGLAVAFLIGRAIVDLLYGVAPAEPRLFVTAIVAVSVIALISAVIPAWHAATQDPRRFLQQD